MNDIVTEDKKYQCFVNVSVPVLALPGELTYGLKPYMVTCFLCGKTEGIAMWTKASAKELFVADGWKLSSKPTHWICPTCVSGNKE